MDPDINSPRIQSWNLTVEKQLGSQWGAAISYLGSHSDRLWAQVARNPGVYMGLGPCTINGVNYPVCSTNANLNQRRTLFQINPREAAFLGAIDENTANRLTHPQGQQGGGGGEGGGGGGGEGGGGKLGVLFKLVFWGVFVCFFVFCLFLGWG
jgi:hypothetical protein